MGEPYYALRRGEAGAEERLAQALRHLDGIVAAMPFLTGRSFGLADVAFVPWLLRLRDLLGVSLEDHPALEDWLGRVEERPSVAAEVGVVATL